MPVPNRSIRQSHTRPAVHSISRSSSRVSSRNLIGFWILGLCNNFAYVVMLSAAKDILETDSGDHKYNGTHNCRERIVDRQCQRMSTGAVLLADIIPALVVKVTAPLYIRMVPFGFRHLLVVMAQMLSFILVAMSSNVSVALFGVVVASWGSGLGEISYLALASYFDSQVVSMWSSGTGGAGIVAAMAYAVLTDPLMLHLSPNTALYSMLVIPLIFAYTFWFILELPQTVHRVKVCDPKTYVVRQRNDRVSGVRRRSPSSESEIERPLLDGVDEDGGPSGPSPEPTQRGGLHQDFRHITPLFKYMIPLIIVYFAEYFINQGLLELLEFDCSHGFSLSPQSQYRWYQVLYQVGVFISRSSSDLIALPGEVLPVLAMLQVLNATVLYCEAVSRFVSHIFILFCMIIYEGLLGGASYVNTFRVIHEEIPSDRREFSMGFVSISDTFGILLAGFTAIPVHNIVCDSPL
ncbi:Battenin [Trichostrongylus colubriformis]|uniref:Battenin n=1 Tax=Trichostrongylus colubriformis TaxID=6319 RepID=A0AAN8F6S2_TRICO